MKRLNKELFETEQGAVKEFRFLMVLSLHNNDISNVIICIRLNYTVISGQQLQGNWSLLYLQVLQASPYMTMVACYWEHAVCAAASRALNMLKYHGMYVNISMEKGHPTDYYPFCSIAKLFQSQGRTFLWTFVFPCAFTPIKPPVTHIAASCRLLYTLRGERGVNWSVPNPHINMMQPFISAFVVT